MFSWLDSPPSRVSLPYSGLPSLSQRPVITECHSHQYRQKWGRSRAVSSLCPLSLCHLFHSAADLHFPHSSICCFLYQTRAFLDLGSICIFLGHLPLLPILYTSLLCLALVRSSFFFFNLCISLAAFRLYSCLLGWIALEFRKGYPWKSTSFPEALFFLGMWNSSRQVPGQTKVCFTQVQGCNLGIYLLHFSQAPHHVMVAAAKAAPDLTFLTYSSLLLNIMSSRVSSCRIHSQHLRKLSPISPMLQKH